MGNSAATYERLHSHVSQRYLAIDRAVMSPDGGHLFAKVMYDHDHFSPSFILKVEVATSLILDRFFLKEATVDRMAVSDHSEFLAVQTPKLFYLFDVAQKRPLVQLELTSHWFHFVGSSLFFRINRGAFAHMDLRQCTFRNFLEFDNRLEKIGQLLVPAAQRHCFLVAHFKRKTHNRIVKFDLLTNQIVAVFKCSSDIKTMLWAEGRQYLVIGKYTDVISVFRTENDFQCVANLSFDGLLRDVAEVKGRDRLTAFYECERSRCFCIWNLETFQLETRIRADIEQSSVYFRILLADSHHIYVQNDTEIVRLVPFVPQQSVRSAAAQEEEEQFDFSMKKLLTVMRTSRLQKLVLQTSADFRAPRSLVSDDLRLSKLKENESMFLNSVDANSLPLHSKKISYIPRIVDTLSELEDHLDHRDTTVTKRGRPSRHLDTRLSKLIEMSLPFVSQVKGESRFTDKLNGSFFGPKNSSEDHEGRRTVVKPSRSTKTYLSSEKKTSQRSENDFLADDDNLTIKRERSSLSLARAV